MELSTEASAGMDAGAPQTGVTVRASALLGNPTVQEALLEISGCFQCVIDERLVWEEVTGGWQEITGFPPEQTLGRSVVEAFLDEDRALAEAVVGTALNQPGTQRLEARVITAQGGFRWIELALQQVTLGERQVVVGQGRDQTEQHLRQEAIHRSESHYRALIEQMPAAVYRRSPAGCMLLVSPQIEPITGYAPSRWRVDPTLWERLLHVEDRARVVREVGEAVAQGRGYRLEYRIVSRDGAVRWILDECRLLTGDPPLRQGVLLDVTERREAEEQRRSFELHLRETQKLESLGLLAGGIAHDFNNLLTVVHGHADLALVRLPAGSEVRGPVEKIAQTVTRMAELTNQMLAYSGRGKFVIKRIDLNQFVRETTDFLKVSITKRAQLEFHLAAQPPWIEADVAQIRQVLLNLITNASEALPERGGVIRVRTGEEVLGLEDLAKIPWRSELSPGRFAYFEVEDTGCGMSDETARRIFEPFFTTKFSGRGLGLSAVQGIVRSHRGIMRLTTQSGVGTCFHVTIPASAPLALSAGGEEDGSGQPKPAGQRILVIDDEEALQQVLAGFLEALGFGWHSATDGAAAVEHFRSDPTAYAGVLLDLTMPRMSGIEVLAEIKAIRPETPVLLMSGYAEQEVGRLISDGRCAGFLSKPFRLKQLSEKLSAALQSVPRGANSGRI